MLCEIGYILENGTCSTDKILKSLTPTVCSGRYIDD